MAAKSLDQQHLRKVEASEPQVRRRECGGWRAGIERDVDEVKVYYGFTIHNHITSCGHISLASEKEWARAIAYITNQHMHPIQSFVLEA